jgi:hypothetical protein
MARARPVVRVEPNRVALWASRTSEAGSCSASSAGIQFMVLLMVRALAAA